MTEPLTLAAALDICMTSVPAGAAIVPDGAVTVFAEPGPELRVSVATVGGDVIAIYRPAPETVTGCSLWGGDFSDEDAPFTLHWAERGEEALAWLDRTAHGPDAIDLRHHPDHEAVYLCEAKDALPISLGIGSFRFRDEIAEEPPPYPPDGGILAEFHRRPDLTRAGLKETRDA